MPPVLPALSSPVILPSLDHVIPSGPTSPEWRGFLRVLAVALVAFVAGPYGFVLALDPYGTRTSPARAPVPIMDLNGRYMYPQLTRSGRFDAAVFGTSTIRLLDPEALGRSFGGHVVNLGLNAGTPWEQTELARLFLRHVPSPRLLIFGLDRPWCAPDADEPGRRLTFRSFPPWLYDEEGLNDLPGMLSLKSVEIAGRVLLNRLGFMPERIRGDGYENFLPPESRYDLRRAQAHLREGTGEAAGPDGAEPEPGAAGAGFPALVWLDGLLAPLPASTQTVLLLPPIHVAAQARPGTPGAAQDEACKAALAAIARRRGAALVDLRFASPLTSRDENYWDKLHYRLPIAARLLGHLATALASGRDDPGGEFRVLAPGRVSQP